MLKLHRRALGAVAFATSTLLLLPSCGKSSASNTPSSTTANAAAGACAGAAWDALVSAAKAEGGTVNVAGPPADDIRTKVPAAFKADTGISIAYNGTQASTLAGKVQAARQAGKYDQDVYLGGASTLVTVFGTSGWLVPLRSLMLPGNLDGSHWIEGKVPFIDPNEQELLLASSVAAAMVVNTKYVKAGDLSSWKDLLKPEFNGKVVTDTVTSGGTAASVVAMFLQQPDLGQAFVKQLYVDQKSAILQESTQEINSLANGRYWVGIGLKDTDIAQAQRDGLPIAAVSPSDGLPIINGGQGVLAIADKAPHPKAAQLLANWLACPAGNTVFNTAQGKLSTVSGVTIPDLDESQAMKPGVKYFDSYSYDFVTTGKQDAEKYMKTLLGG